MGLHLAKIDHSPLHFVLAAAVLLVTTSGVSGCGSSGEAGDVGSMGAAGSSTAGGAGNQGSGGVNQGGSSVLPDIEVYGGVTVSLNAALEAGEPGFTSVVGRFFDGEAPALVQLELDTEMGECQLMVPVVPFCPEACAPAVCTADDVCTPYPMPIAVGSLSVSGLGDALSIEPKTTMQVYQGPSLPNPPCEAGSTITASASGLMLEAECIEPLVLTGADPIPVASGQVVEVRWEAAQGSTSSRIRIRLDIAHHGGKKGEINCEVADTGSFDIPEPLVTKLIGLGLAGFPDISVTRVSSGSDAKHQDVTLLVSSNVMRPVDTGVVSCQEKEQCPGQDCLDTHVCG